MADDTSRSDSEANAEAGIDPVTVVIGKETIEPNTSREEIMKSLSEMEGQQKVNPTAGSTIFRRAKPGGPKAPLFQAHIRRDPESGKWWVIEEERRFTSG